MGLQLFAVLGPARILSHSLVCVCLPPYLSCPPCPPCLPVLPTLLPCHPHSPTPEAILVDSSSIAVPSLVCCFLFYAALRMVWTMQHNASLLSLLLHPSFNHPFHHLVLWSCLDTPAWAHYFKSCGTTKRSTCNAWLAVGSESGEVIAREQRVSTVVPSFFRSTCSLLNVNFPYTHGLIYSHYCHQDTIFTWALYFTSHKKNSFPHIVGRYRCWLSTFFTSLSLNGIKSEVFFVGKVIFLIPYLNPAYKFNCSRAQILFSDSPECFGMVLRASTHLKRNTFPSLFFKSIVMYM